MSARHVRTPHQEPNVGIMFGDVKGYSKLSADNVFHFYQAALPQLARNLRDALAGCGVEDPLQTQTWGDGIACVHASPRAAALYALHLAKEFDKALWQDGLTRTTPCLLRIRIALHTGHLWRGTRNWVSGGEQYVGNEMVLPARLEPKVKPGEVWCTGEFKHALLGSAEAPETVVFDDLSKVVLPKDAGEVQVYRVRFRRREEDQLQKRERELSNSDRPGRGGAFARKASELWGLMGREFLPISTYPGWLELGEALLHHGCHGQADELLREYMGSRQRAKLLSVEDEIRLKCVLANCASKCAEEEEDQDNRRDALGRARDLLAPYLNREIKTTDDRIELRSVLAAQEKRLALLEPDLVKKRALLQEAHKHYLSAYKDDGFDYYPGINAAATALLLACLHAQGKPQKSHYSRLSSSIACSIVHRFEMRAPTDFWESATLAEAYVLLGKPRKAENAVSQFVGNGYQQSSLRQQMGALTRFPGLRPKVVKAAEAVLRAI